MWSHFLPRTQGTRCFCHWYDGDRLIPAFTCLVVMWCVCVSTARCSLLLPQRFTSCGLRINKLPPGLIQLDAVVSNCLGRNEDAWWVPSGWSVAWKRSNCTRQRKPPPGPNNPSHDYRRSKPNIAQPEFVPFMYSHYIRVTGTWICVLHQISVNSVKLRSFNNL